MANLKIKLVRGFQGRKDDQIATAHSLGLRKIGNEVIQPDNAATKGKIKKISHLVEVTMKLHELSPAPGSTKKAFRVGRGAGSGNGKTAGKGHKGQKARSGGGVRPGFEGGQMPLQRRIPKRGFNNIFAKQFAIVNVSDLERFDNDTVVTEELLVQTGLVKKALDGVKILGNGDLSKKLTVNATAFSASAKEKIEKAGGKAEVI